MLNTPNSLTLKNNSDYSLVPDGNTNDDNLCSDAALDLLVDEIIKAAQDANIKTNNSSETNDSASSVEDVAHNNNQTNIGKNMSFNQQGVHVFGKNMDPIDHYSSVEQVSTDANVPNEYSGQSSIAFEKDVRMVSSSYSLNQYDNHNLLHGDQSLSDSSVINKITIPNSTLLTIGVNDSTSMHETTNAIGNHHDGYIHNVNLDDLSKCNCYACETAQQHKFNLTIPTENEKPEKAFQMKRKSFALACRTNMTKEDIMEHIKNEFNDLLQYVCISSYFNATQTNCASSPMVFIQIVLKKLIHTKSYFLKKVAGMECNYKVTTNDRAWNIFLKKVGKYIGDGQFQSVKARAGTKWSKTLKHKRKEMVIESRMQSSYDQMETNQEIEKDVTEDILIKLKIFIEDSINRADDEIAVECVDKRNRVLPLLTSFHSMVQFVLNK